MTSILKRNGNEYITWPFLQDIKQIKKEKALRNMLQKQKNQVVTLLCLKLLNPNPIFVIDLKISRNKAIQISLII
jgi:hypothetical protein